MAKLPGPPITSAAVVVQQVRLLVQHRQRVDGDAGGDADVAHRAGRAPLVVPPIAGDIEHQPRRLGRAARQQGEAGGHPLPQRRGAGRGSRGAASMAAAKPLGRRRRRPAASRARRAPGAATCPTRTASPPPPPRAARRRRGRRCRHRGRRQRSRRPSGRIRRSPRWRTHRRRGRGRDRRGPCGCGHSAFRGRRAHPAAEPVQGQGCCELAALARQPPHSAAGGTAPMTNDRSGWPPARRRPPSIFPRTGQCQAGPGNRALGRCRGFP